MVFRLYVPVALTESFPDVSFVAVIVTVPSPVYVIPSRSALIASAVASSLAVYWTLLSPDVSAPSPVLKIPPVGDSGIAKPVPVNEMLYDSYGFVVPLP